MVIGRKMGICVGTLAGMAALLGAAGWFCTSALSDRLQESIGVTTRKIELSSDLKANVFAFRLQERGMLLFSYINSPEQVAACRNAYDKAMNGAFARIEDIRSLLTSDSGRHLLDQIKAGVEEYKTLQLNVRQILADGKVPEATAYDKKMLVPVGGKIVEAIDAFNSLQHNANVTAADEAASLRTTARVTLSLGMLACFPLAVVIGIVIRKATRDLRNAARDLDRTAAQVTSAAGQIASSSQSLAQSTSEQAASLEETSAATSEINAMTQQNTNNSQAAANTVGESQQSFGLANRHLEDAVSAMSEITASSHKISKIIKVIDEIAFQTNILALNAAVEAARAGEAGLGFAVVADEVRTLAKRCADAARDTTVLIEESVSTAGQGKAKVDSVALAMNAIVEQAGKVKTLVDEVYHGSQEQAHGIEQIAKAVSQMESVTQNTAASAEESASAAEELSAQAQALRTIVAGLGTLVGAHAEG